MYALSSNDETLDHLETLWETKSLSDNVQYKQLHQKIQRLGKMINGFTQSVEKQHQYPK